MSTNKTKTKRVIRIVLSILLHLPYMQREVTLNTFLGHSVDEMLAEMRKESFSLQREINNTSRWRKIKRYHLFEKLYKLDEDRGLMAHVLNDDEGY